MLLTLLRSICSGQTVYSGPGGTAALPITGNWSPNANWIGGVSPTPGGAGTSLSFSQTAAGAQFAATNNNGGNNFLLTTLALNNSTNNVNVVDSLAGDPLEFVTSGGGTAPTLTTAGNAAFNIGNSIVVTNAATFTQSGSSTNFLSGGLTLTAGLTVSGAGTGTISQTGAVTGAGAITLNGTVDGTGSGPRYSLTNAANNFSGGVTLTNGRLFLSGNSDAAPVTMGPIGTGTLTINGTAVSAALTGTATISNPVTLGSGVHIGDPILAGASTITLKGSVALTANTTININRFSTVTFAGGMTEGGVSRGLAKTGFGTMVIAPGTTAAISGAVTANNGFLVVNGNLGTAASRITSLMVGDSNVGANPSAISGSGKVFVNANAVTGRVQILRNGKIRPGNSPGVLSIDGGLSLSPASGTDPAGIAEFEIDPVADNTSQIVVTGGLDLNGGSLSVILDSAPVLSQRFDIISSDSPTPTFFAEGSTVDAIFGGFDYVFDVNYRGDPNSPLSMGNDVILTNIAAIPIPEPSTLMLLALGVVGLMVVRRRR